MQSMRTTKTFFLCLLFSYIEIDRRKINTYLIKHSVILMINPAKLLPFSSEIISKYPMTSPWIVLSPLNIADFEVRSKS